MRNGFRTGFLGQIATPQDGTLLDEALTQMEASEWSGARVLLTEALDHPGMLRDAQLLLAEVCQAQGDRDTGLHYLNEALALNPLTSRGSVGAPRRRVLALAVPGDFQANLPLSMLLDDDQTELHTLWITDPAMILADPWHARALVPRNIDAIFTVIAQDDRHIEALRAAEALIGVLDLPSLNNPRAIAGLSRLGAAARLGGCDDLVVPEPRAISAKALSLEFGGRRMSDDIIIRPEGSHAGRGLAHITSQDALRDYLDTHATEMSFTVAPFIDYSSADGLWRKYRIVCVGGTWLPLHMAIHSDWAVWYYNAGMQFHADRRQEEARFLHTPHEALPERALRALSFIAQHVQLDYFGVDFGILPDGRVVLFEIETGMIVHDRDDPTLFAYRSPAVRAIRHATEWLIDQRIGRRGQIERRAPVGIVAGREMYTVTRRLSAPRLHASGDPLVGAHVPVEALAV